MIPPAPASLNKAPPTKDSSARRKMGIPEEQRTRQTLELKERLQNQGVTVNYLPLGHLTAPASLDFWNSWHFLFKMAFLSFLYFVDHILPATEKNPTLRDGRGTFSG